jgi:predicted PurR-regulated permease PerM
VIVNAAQGLVHLVLNLIPVIGPILGKIVGIIL